MGTVYYGQILETKYIRIDQMLDLDTLYNIDHKIDKLKKYLNNPDNYIFSTKIRKKYKVVMKSNAEKSLNKNDTLIINNVECFVTDLKYDVNNKTLHVYTDYKIETLPDNKDEYDKTKKGFIEDVKRKLNDFGYNKVDISFSKAKRSENNKKWYQFWK